jgi:alpha-tubulin suppressor-like RCC1 family protein
MSWQPQLMPFGQAYLNKVVFSSDASQIIVAASNNLNYSGGTVFQSLDTGATWTNILGVQSNLIISDIAISKDKSKTVVVCSRPTDDNVRTSAVYFYIINNINNNIILKTTQSALSVNTDLLSVAIDSTGTNIVIGTSDSLYISRNGGNSWSQIGSGYNHNDVSISDDGSRIIVAGFSSNNDNVIPRISTNNGTSFSNINTAGNDWYCVDSSASGQNLVVGGKNKIIASSNYGNTWNIASGISLTDGISSSWTCTDVSISDNGQKLVAIIRLDAGSLRDIFVSYDGGLNWVRDSFRLVQSNSISISETNDSIFIALVPFYGTLYLQSIPKTWDINILITEPNQTFDISIFGSPNITIDWGNDLTQVVTSQSTVTRSYANIGYYTVKIYGSFNTSGGNIRFSQSPINPKCIVSVGPIPYIANLTSMIATFIGNTNLESIPWDLFYYNPQILIFNSVFRGCNKLTSIPNSLFDNNTSAIDFTATFAETSVENIPVDLFKYNKEVIYFSIVFQNTAITNIPQDLFRYNTKVKQFVNSFAFCPNLTSLPQDLLSYNTLAIDFVNIFFNTPINTFSYSRLLNELSVTNFNTSNNGLPVRLGAQSSKYNSSAINARQTLVNRNWEIVDAGLDQIVTTTTTTTTTTVAPTTTTTTTTVVPTTTTTTTTVVPTTTTTTTTVVPTTTTTTTTVVPTTTTTTTTVVPTTTTTTTTVTTTPPVPRSLFTWGNNGSGEIGDGTQFPKLSPVQLSNNWVVISAGGGYSAAIRSDGKLFTWGNNSDGQLGDGTQTSKLIPTQIGNDNWTNIYAGMGGFTFAIRSDGKLFAWGTNSFGQLGDGTLIRRLTPVQIGNDNWASISVGRYHSLGIRSDGKLFVWGNNNYGQLGDGTQTRKLTPAQIGNDNWSSVAAGFASSFAIRSDGKLFAWGDNNNGQLGDGTLVYKLIPTQIGNDSWILVCASDPFTLAIRSDNKLFGWGINVNGVLDGSTLTPKYEPTQIGNDNWIFVNAKNTHILAVRSDNKLFAWGENNVGQFGDGTTLPKSSPSQIGNNNWSYVSAGNAHSMALSLDIIQTTTSTTAPPTTTTTSTTFTPTISTTTTTTTTTINPFFLMVPQMTTSTKQYTVIKLRRATEDDFITSNLVLASGEPAYASDTKTFKIGNGSSDWDNLPAFTSTDINIYNIGSTNGNVSIDWASNKQSQRVTLTGTSTIIKGIGWPTSDISRQTDLEIYVSGNTNITWSIVGSNWYNKPSSSVLPSGTHKFNLKSSGPNIIEGNYLGSKSSL